MPRPQVVTNDEHVTRVTVTPNGDDGNDEDSSTASATSTLDDEDDLFQNQYCRNRKVSLMPALTEEDMLSSLGQRDPLLVSQIIGARGGAVEEEDEEEPPTMCRIHIGERGTNVIQGVLANEASIRPDVCPETMSSIQVPQISIESNGAENDIDLPDGPKLKFRSNHNPPQRSQSDIVHMRRPRIVQNTIEAQTLQLTKFHAEIAAENPDMIHFQQVLNAWIVAQTGAKSAAFLLISEECNSCYCQVVGSELLDEAVHCAEDTILANLLSSSQSDSDDDDPLGGLQQRAIDINDPILHPTFRKNILDITVDGMRRSGRDISGTVIPVKARCGFVTGLVMIHRSEHTKDAELSAILPHVSMIGTLMSIVANVEEQKRLARQSQVFLTMAHNVFSSLRSVLPQIRHFYDNDGMTPKP
ncbi:hypothetical protein L596_025786 [Steinernema carpocapsae]|uniref:Uncharacterized protein n=1 Tax=Steinernema carpocapsae TaxID=34508 RepID=A0A4V5ZYZ0_STECR|nr:hypothetical protein L596_025786 [Steinernema carpocapsae]